MNPLAPVMEDPHVYEDIHEMLGRLPEVPRGSDCSTTEEVITAPCPAYISTTKPAQLDAVVYDVIQASGDDASQNLVVSTSEYGNL